MNKISTAVYMLIFVVVLLLAFAVSKPAVMTTDGKTKTGYLKLWNFGSDAKK